METCMAPVGFYRCVPNPATLCAGVPLVYAPDAVDSARTGYAVCRRLSASRKRIRAKCRISADNPALFGWCYVRNGV